MQDRPRTVVGSSLSLDRRTLLRTAGAFGAGIAAPSLLMPGRARAATRGGHLKVGFSHGSTTDSLEPGTYEHGLAILISYTIHGKLTIVGPDGKLHGDLAESWEASDRATKWTFKLRDAQFHNGKPVTAADVIASLNHHRGEATTSNAKTLLAPVTNLSADGDRTVVVELASGDADFPYTLTDYQLAICQADADGKMLWQDDGSRSGPYRLTDFDPGVRVVFERANNHWNSGIGHLDSAEVLVISDVTARQNALLTGEVDLIDRPDVRTLEMLRQAPNLVIEEAPGFHFYGFTMFCDTPPFDNNDVRLALKYAIDREAALDVAVKGHGVIANDHPITPAYRFYNDSIPQRTYDPDKAAFHLKKAGYSSLDIDLSASAAAFGAAVDCSVLYKSNAGKAGININVVNEPADGYWSNVWLKKPFIANNWGGRPTEDQMFSVAYEKGAPWNDTHFGDERFNMLLKEARAELDEPKRREMYAEMQQIVHDIGGVIVPIIPNNIWAFNQRVKHDPDISNVWQIDGLQFVSRWWVEQ